MAECRHHAGYACPNQVVPHHPENKLPKPKRRQSTEYRVAVALSIILDESGDNPDNPAAIRIEQAKQLTSLWASTSILGPLREVVNLKRGYCVRCPVDETGSRKSPCPVCGADDSKVRPL